MSGEDSLSGGQSSVGGECPITFNVGFAQGVLIILAGCLVLSAIPFRYLLCILRPRKFAGKVVLITGGSEGIGFELAKLLFKDGAQVALIARTASKLEAAKSSMQSEDIMQLRCRSLKAAGYVISEPEQLGGQSTPLLKNANEPYIHVADVADYKQVEDAVKAVRSQLGPIDMVIANAGVSTQGYFLDLPLDKFRQAMDVNYFGAVHVVKAVLPDMVVRNSGHVVIIGSALSIFGLAGAAAYSASKFAVRSVAEVLRMELTGTNIKVSLALPPDTDTPGYQVNEANNLIPEQGEVAGWPFSKSATLVSARQVAASMLPGLRRGDYLLNSPDPMQQIAANLAQVLTPQNGPVAFQFLLVLVQWPVTAVYRAAVDGINRSHCHKRLGSHTKKPVQ